MRAVAALAVSHLAGPPASRPPRASPSGAASNISLRKRLHVNTLITQPGTFELDWSGLYSFTNDAFTMPAALKYTPEGKHILWGRTEYSIAFDSLSVADIGGGPLVEFSRSLTMTATAVVHDGKWLDIAVAPQAIVYLRDESGTRLGAVAIARCDVGRNSIGGTFSWSGATHSFADEPGRHHRRGIRIRPPILGLGRGEQVQSAHQRPVGEVHRTDADSGGVRRGGIPGHERLAFDLSGQQFGYGGGIVDHQVVFGLTLNFGKPH